MSKTFTLLAAIVFLAVAAAHAYRIYAGLSVTVVGHYDVPMWVSWAGVAVPAVLAVLLLSERRRG